MAVGQQFKRAYVLAEGINRNRNTLSGRGVTASRASRAWEVSETWVGNDEEQLLELEGQESDGSVRGLEDDSDDVI